jgi:hypothetical protein
VMNDHRSVHPIDELIRNCGLDPETVRQQLISEIIEGRLENMDDQGRLDDDPEWTGRWDDQGRLDEDLIRSRLAGYLVTEGGRPGAAKNDVPKFSEFMLALVLKPGQEDAILGDLEQRFKRNVKKCGRQRALWRYRAETFKTTCVLLWPKLKSLGLFGLLATVFKHFLG